MQGNREFIYLVPAAKHFADYRPYELKVVSHTAVVNLSDYSTMSAAGVTHFFHGQVRHDLHTNQVLTSVTIENHVLTAASIHAI